MAECPHAKRRGVPVIPAEGGAEVTNNPKRVLFVCLFNLQRSVVAESMFEQLLAADGPAEVEGIEVLSAGFVGQGVRAWFRELGLAIPDPPFGREMPGATRTALLERGIDISGYRSREADLDLLTSSDLVICMLPEIRRDLVGAHRELEGKLFVLQDFLEAETEFYWEKTSTFPHDDTYFEFVHNDPAYVGTVIRELEESIGRAYPAIVDRLRADVTATPGGKLA